MSQQDSNFYVVLTHKNQWKVVNWYCYHQDIVWQLNNEKKMMKWNLSEAPSIFPILFNFILFYSILFYFILFYFILTVSIFNLSLPLYRFSPSLLFIFLKVDGTMWGWVWNAWLLSPMPLDVHLSYHPSNTCTYSVKHTKVDTLKHYCQFRLLTNCFCNYSNCMIG